MAYQFIDAYSSIQTASSSVVSGAHQPIVQIQSVLSAIPVNFSGSPSISGAVTVVGNPSISGTVNITGNPSISGTVNITGNPSISGTVAVTQQGTWIASVASSTPSSMLVGASIIGLTPVTATITGNPSISGTVAVTQQGNWTTSIVSTVPSSVLVGASIIGLTPVAVTNTPSISGTVNIAGTPSISGGVTISGNPSISGTVNIGGTNSSSIYGMRNDAIASFLGADLTERPIATDSAGRVLTKPFSAEESRVEGYITLTSTSVTTLVAAAGAGLRNYITDFWAANTDSTNGTLITMKDGAGSILGYTIAPSKSGSNLPGLSMPIRTGANATFDVQAGTAASTLYVTVKGFKAP